MDDLEAAKPFPQTLFSLDGTRHQGSLAGLPAG